MKKIFTLLTALVVSITIFAQYSTVKPTVVLWKAQGKNYTLIKGRYGIPQAENLSLEMYFPASKLQYYKQQNLKLEFRWYYYLSTRKKLVQTQTVSIHSAKLTNQGSFKLTSTLSGVQPGWWEVSVTASIDNRPVVFGKTYRYQVFIKKGQAR